MAQISQRLLLATIFVAVLVAPGVTRAQASSPADTAPQTVGTPTSSVPLPPPSGPLPIPAPALSDKPAGLDFEFFGPEDASTSGPDSDAKVAKTSALSQTRRHRLGIHQFLGLTTWAFMGASCIVGQLNYNDLYGGGSGRGNYQLPHRLLVYSTAGLFTATGIYSLLAPQPYKKPLKFDSGLVHRIAAIGATAGMVAEVVLGFITARTADSGNSSGIKQMATIHDAVGWTTFGFMTAAGTAWLF